MVFGIQNERGRNLIKRNIEYTWYMKKIALFIDQANLWGSYKRVGSLIDFKLLLEYLEKTFDGKVIVKNIYFAYPWDWTRDYDVKWIHRFWVFLKKELWFRVVKKELKRIEVRDEKNNIVLDKDIDILNNPANEFLVYGLLFSKYALNLS